MNHHAEDVTVSTDETAAVETRCGRPHTARVGRRRRTHLRRPAVAGRTCAGPTSGPSPSREEPARRAAARFADVALVRGTGRARAAAAGDRLGEAAARDRLREAAAAYGRGPRVLASLLVDPGGGEHAAEPGAAGRGSRPGRGRGGPRRRTARGALYRGGPVDLAEPIAARCTGGAADGFPRTPVGPRRDLERPVGGTAAPLQHRGLFRTFCPGGTLRDHRGLAAPVVRHTAAGDAS
ncbi:hypothetical protein [Streptomyces sp. H51]|uniref:hypothetical protein n=1 Tax=Streptomyces sp. H51 TaxID=3111770 RepID=UPI003B63BA77